MTEARNYVLPDSLMHCIETITHEEELSPHDRLVGVLILVFGWALYQQQDKIDPTLVRIPQAQWHQICGGLASGVTLDPITGVNLGLEFMNKGPSAYVEEGAPA